VYNGNYNLPSQPFHALKKPQRDFTSVERGISDTGFFHQGLTIRIFFPFLKFYLFSGMMSMSIANNGTPEVFEKTEPFSML